MKVYEVKSPLRHNGVRYEINHIVELTDSEAKRLMSKDVIAHAAPLITIEALTEVLKVEELSEQPTIETVKGWLDDYSVTETVIDEAWGRYKEWLSNSDNGESEKPDEIPALAIAELFAYAEMPKDAKPSAKEALKIIKAQADSITDPETGYTWQAKDYVIKAGLRDEAWELYLAMPFDEPPEDDNEDSE